MNSDDLLSIIIAIIAIVYSILSMAKKSQDKREETRRQYEDEDEYEEEDEEQKIHHPLPPPPKLEVAKTGSYEFHTKLDDYVSPLESTEGAVVKQKKKTNIATLVRELPEKKMLFLSYEVFSEPVSKRKSPFPWNG